MDDTRQVRAERQGAAAAYMVQAERVDPVW